MSTWLVVRSAPLSDELLELYEAWYGEHLRKLLAVPGVLSAVRFTRNVYREIALP
jgi:hypothetical protein